MMPSQVTFGRICDDAIRLVFAHWALFLTIIFGTGGMYSFADLQGNVSLGNTIYIVGGFAVLYLQLFLTVRMVRADGLLAGGNHENGSPTLGLFFRAFGLSLIFSVAVGAGLIFLIIPGIWLVTIWFVSLPVMVVENLSITESLGRSKRLVDQRFWLVLGVVALVGVGFVLVGGALVYLAPAPSIGNAFPIIFLNILGQAVIASGWVLSVAVFRQLLSQEGGGPVREVFA